MLNLSHGVKVDLLTAETNVNGSLVLGKDRVWQVGAGANLGAYVGKLKSMSAGTIPILGVGIRIEHEETYTDASAHIGGNINGYFNEKTLGASFEIEWNFGWITGGGKKYKISTPWK
jgi:hypothetical protein